jgi:hypothetical protein
VGGAFFVYNPTQVGTYSMQMSYTGQHFDARFSPPYFPGYPNIPFPEADYAPSTSNVVEVIVQEDPIPDYPDNPITTDYWERPIDAQNKGWGTISSNWLMAGGKNYARSFHGGSGIEPENQGPNAPHILWRKPIQFGGLVGSEHGDKSYYGGLSYESKFMPPLIINGILYYNKPDPPSYGWYAVDLNNGEELWYNNGTGPHGAFVDLFGTQLYPQLDMGQLLSYETGNQHGIIPYLWSTSGGEFAAGSFWYMYDAFTGNLILMIEDVPSGTITFSDKGDILIYSIGGGKLSLWNSTLNIPPASPTGTGRISWRPNNYAGQTLNGSDGIQWVKNVTFGSTIRLIEDGVITVTQGNDIGTYDAMTGALLSGPVTLDKNVPAGVETDGTLVHDGVYVEWHRQLLQWWGYSVATGQEIWRTEPLEDQWAYYSYIEAGVYGNLYAAGYDGKVTCWDIQTGEKLWDYYSGQALGETPYGNYPFYGGFTIAGERIYIGGDEHSPDAVPYRGQQLHCIDALTGELIWKINGWYLRPVVADQRLVAHNLYDNQIYCFGKGPTQTTVSAPKVEIMQGQKVVIEGTITDQSPGKPGIACVSDEDMGVWMNYVYNQKPVPASAMGVDVTIDVIDANGNFRSIGTATSNMAGKYSLVWEPEIPGEYTVIATFAGTNSYGSSYDQTTMYVEQAPEPTPPPEPTPEPLTDTYVLGMGAVAIISIVVFGLLILLMLRKK